MLFDIYYVFGLIYESICSLRFEMFKFPEIVITCVDLGQHCILVRWIILRKVKVSIIKKLNRTHHDDKLSSMCTFILFCSTKLQFYELMN